MITFTVYGTPAPKGSKRFVGLSKLGRGILVESSKKEKPWAEAVKYAALQAKEDAGGGLDGPISVVMFFTLKKPASAPKRKITYPDKKPDLDKIIRSTADAMVASGIIHDDSRIVQIVAAKFYPGEASQALTSPGVRITISDYRLTNTQAVSDSGTEGELQ